MRESKGRGIVGFPSNYVVLDIETTGLDPSVDEIIELAAIRVMDDVRTDTFNSLVRPTNPISGFITELTGITNDMVSRAPRVEDILPQFCEFLGGDVVVGHNVNFDINFIYDNLMKCSNRLFGNDFIDLLRIARKTLPRLENHRLETICRQFAVDTTAHHRGMKDCDMANECFRHCRELAVQSFGNIDEFINMFGHKVTAKGIMAAKDEFDEEHPLFNQVCVFTGTLVGMERREAMQAVVNVGGRCSDQVTKETNYLIVGSLEYSSNMKGDKSSKILKAEKYLLKGQDIKVISQNTFEDLLNE
jgi:DNA polymerase-3 subunit epsilon